MQFRQGLRSLVLLGAALVAATALLAACDFGVFRSAFAGVTYSIPTVTDEQVLLDESGRFADEEARVHSSFITGTAGDLNGDGILDGVAVLATNTGGTGFFYTVHALLADGDGGFRDVGSVFIGDRVTVTGVELSGPRIEVSRLVRAEDEPFVAAPTIPSPVHLIVEDGELVVATATE